MARVRALQIRLANRGARAQSLRGSRRTAPSQMTPSHNGRTFVIRRNSIARALSATGFMTRSQMAARLRGARKDYAGRFSVKTKNRYARSFANYGGSGWTESKHPRGWGGKFRSK